MSLPKHMPDLLFRFITAPSSVFELHIFFSAERQGLNLNHNALI